jgi:hypothetical protein
MIRKTFLLFTSFVLFVVLAGVQVQAGSKRVPVNWRFSGTLMTNIVVFDATILDTALTGAVHGQLKGSPGTAQLQLFSGRSTDPVFSQDCFDGAGGFTISVTDNPLVITFPDGSLLFANLATGMTGEFCLDFTTGRGEGTIPIMFIGGRGRFEGASGQAMIEGETQAISADGNFSGETATVKGMIILP